MPKNVLDRLRFELLTGNTDSTRELNVPVKSVAPLVDEIKANNYSFCYLYDNHLSSKGWRNDGCKTAWDCKSHWSFPMGGRLRRKIDKIVVDSSRELHRWATQLNTTSSSTSDFNAHEPAKTFIEYFLKAKGKGMDMVSSTSASLGSGGTISRSSLVISPNKSDGVETGTLEAKAQLAKYNHKSSGVKLPAAANRAFNASPISSSLPSSPSSSTYSSGAEAGAKRDVDLSFRRDYTKASLERHTVSVERGQMRRELDEPSWERHDVNFLRNSAGYDFKPTTHKPYDDTCLPLIRAALERQFDDQPADFSQANYADLLSSKFAGAPSAKERPYSSLFGPSQSNLKVEEQLLAIERCMPSIESLSAAHKRQLLSNNFIQSSYACSDPVSFAVLLCMWRQNPTAHAQAISMMYNAVVSLQAKAVLPNDEFTTPPPLPSITMYRGGTIVGSLSFSDRPLDGCASSKKRKELTEALDGKRPRIMEVSSLLF